MVAIVSVSDGNVDVAANWSPAQVPTDSDDVTISHYMGVPSGVTFKPLSLVLQGTSDSARGSLLSAGTYDAAGGCTLGAWNELGTLPGGVIDLAGGDIETSGSTAAHNTLNFTGSTTNWARVKDSVGGGSIAGVSGANMRGSLTMQYCTLDSITGGFKCGGAYAGGAPINVSHAVFYDMGYWEIGAPFIDGDDDFIFEYVDIVGTQSTTLDGSVTIIGNLSSDREATHSELGTTRVRAITTHFADEIGSVQKLRLTNPYYNLSGIFDNLYVEVITNEGATASNALLVNRSLALALGSFDTVTDSYYYTPKDNPHSFGSGDFENIVIEATYEYNNTDGGDHFIVPHDGDMSVIDSLVIDDWGGAAFNALGEVCTGVYEMRHTTIAINAQGYMYGNLIRNEGVGALWGGTVNLYDNLCAVLSNSTGSPDIKAIHLGNSGDDQITTMDNNAFYGYGSDPAYIYGGVTSATKSIGDQDYGESDLIGVDPQFLDSTRRLSTWQDTQNGGGTAEDAISDALLINGYDAATQTQIAANESGFDISAVISWVRTGYAPTAVAYDSTASDGTTIGAVDYLPADLAILSSTTSADGASVTTAFSQNVTTGNGGSAGFTVAATLGAVTLTPTTTTLPASTVEFSTSRIIQNGEVLAGAYAQPGDGFEDESGNDLASGAFAVANVSKVHRLFSDAAQTTAYTTAGVVARLFALTGTADALVTQSVDPDASGYVQLTESLSAGSYRLDLASADGTLTTDLEHTVE